MQIFHPIKDGNLLFCYFTIFLILLSAITVRLKILTYLSTSYGEEADYTTNWARISSV